MAAASGADGRATSEAHDRRMERCRRLMKPLEGRSSRAVEAARIRAFFVHPEFARRGLARLLFERCAADARAQGFRSLELMATLPGEPLYLALGFVPLTRESPTLPDGETLPMVHMRRPLDRD